MLRESTPVSRDQARNVAAPCSMVLVVAICAVLKTLTVFAAGSIPLWGAQFLFELGLFVAQSFLVYGVGVLLWKGWLRIRRSHAAGKYRAPTLSLFLVVFLLAVGAAPASAHVGVVVVETIDAEDDAGNTIAGCPRAVRFSRNGHTHHVTDASGYAFITTRKGDAVDPDTHKLLSSSVPAARLRYRVHHDTITTGPDSILGLSLLALTFGLSKNGPQMPHGLTVENWSCRLHGSQRDSRPRALPAHFRRFRRWR